MPRAAARPPWPPTLADRLGVPRTELDGLFHQPGWTELPTDEFRAVVAEVVDGPGWVVDGNYRQVRDLVWARAQVIVVLDLPRWRVMAPAPPPDRRRGRPGGPSCGTGTANRSATCSRPTPTATWCCGRGGPIDRYHAEVPAEARAEAAHARVVVLSDRRAVAAFPDRLVRGDL